MQEIYLDIETTGLTPIYDTRVTCICAKTVLAETIDWFTYIREDEKELLTLFFDWLKQKPTTDYMLVSKNGTAFDIPTLFIRAIKLGFQYDDIKYILEYYHSDIHLVTKKWVSMDDFARILSCDMKVGTGYEAIGLFEKKQYEQLLAYCKQDVIVLEEVYLKYKTLREMKEKAIPTENFK